MGSSGYFTDGSAIRRISRESVVWLGGGRALLVQSAHPLVAAATVQHSPYREQPWRRFARTMDALYTVVFGSRREADRVAADVRALHERFRGRLTEDVGPFRAGTRYAASDPELQLWVHGALVDSGIAMYEACVGLLEPEAREDYYREMKVVARLFGLQAKALPRTYRDFEAYRQALLQTDTLSIGSDARALAASILYPPVPLALRPALHPLRVLTVALLPSELRERYGLRLDLPGKIVNVGTTRSTRLLLRGMPRGLRLLDPNGRGDGALLRLVRAAAR
jgi:uncharacterized protein (DUF2236 family)